MSNKILRKYVLRFISIYLIFLGSVQAQLPDFTRLVETHSAAVVNISTKQNSVISSEQNEKFDGLLERFLEKNEGYYPEREESSLGSGFIVSKDGYVVTNYHVIAQADEIIVSLSDRRELKASLVGVDKRSDMALLKVEENDLPVLDIGSSDGLKVGEWVVAIGSPFGFDHSVTAGIVSAKGRSLPSENYVPFIQTDVAINPGNSGGPLFNLKGEVVGINSQIFSRTGGFMGVSFAIPIDVAMNVVEQLQAKGKVSRGWLGVYIQEVTRDLALSFGLDNPAGALIVDVIQGGPAQNILQSGDIVLEFDGKKINEASDLPVIVGSTVLSEEIDITVRRGEKTELLKITLSELPSVDSVETVVEKTVSTENILLGMSLVDLDGEAKEILDVEKGVLVQDVLGDPAKSAGIETGDLIMMFKGVHLEDLDQLMTLSEDVVQGKTYALLILRDGAAQFLALKAE